MRFPRFIAAHSIGLQVVPQSLTCGRLLHSVRCMVRTCGILLAFILCWPGAGRSAVVTGLYEAEVPVPDQSTASQKQGVANALLNVLIKLTGDREVQGRAGAASLLDH